MTFQACILLNCKNVPVSLRVKVFEQRIWLSAGTDLVRTPTKILKITCKRVQEIDFKTYIHKGTEFLTLFLWGDLVFGSHLLGCKEHY